MVASGTSRREALIRSAMTLRTPVNGMRTSPSAGDPLVPVSWAMRASTSARMTSESGPDPWMLVASMPCSRAILRTSGETTGERRPSTGSAGVVATAVPRPRNRPVGTARFEVFRAVVP